jgi:hypothetical protein
MKIILFTILIMCLHNILCYMHFQYPIVFYLEGVVHVLGLLSIKQIIKGTWE